MRYFLVNAVLALTVFCTISEPLSALAAIQLPAATSAALTTAPNTALTPQQLSIAPTHQQSFSNIIENAIPATVNISTLQRVSKSRPKYGFELPFGTQEHQDMLSLLQPYEDDNLKKPLRKELFSLGSGFIIDPKGYIVTNSHVIEDADEISVTLGGEDLKSYKAKVVGNDPKTDLALLKIEAGYDLPFLNFGDSDKAKVGDFVLVVGNPFGLGGSVSLGIVSAKARDINSGHYDDFIQTDAAINVGNSGGPMLNTAGEVIGVNSIILSPFKGNIGIGFAIPASMVQHVVAKLKENGKVIRGQMGVTIQGIDKGIAEGLGLTSTNGALVSGILKGSPAERSGLKVGDVIVKFNSKPITSSAQLPKLVGEIEVGKVVDLEIMRDQRALHLQVTVEVPKEENSQVANIHSRAGHTVIFGMRVLEINEMLAQKFDLPLNTKGVVVVAVDRGSLAAMSDIKPGDIVVGVNKKEIKTMADFDNALSSQVKAKKKSATFLLKRGDASFFISLEESVNE